MSELNRRASDNLIIEMHRDLGVLCKQMEQITGNGNPSGGTLGLITQELDAIDTRVQALEGWKKWVNGISAAVATLFTVVATFWRYVFVVKVGRGE